MLELISTYLHKILNVNSNMKIHKILKILLYKK